MIKAAKRAIASILGNADITDEELVTAVVAAEALINSRPLTYQTANPSDESPLTPNHFLIGQVGGAFAPESVDEEAVNPRRRWRRVEELIKHFWGRWLREWIPGLNRRTKWPIRQKELKVGDAVLVLKPDVPRGQWPVGRIVEVFPGADNLVRVVSVKAEGKMFTRPITKVCPLEF